MLQARHSMNRMVMMHNMHTVQQCLLIHCWLLITYVALFVVSWVLLTVWQFRLPPAAAAVLLMCLEPN
jgi:hypothetical protein